MTDQQAAPKIELLSQAQIDELEQKILENESAKERQESPPHVITQEMMKACVLSMRARRGTVNSTKTKLGKDVKVSNLNIDDL